MVLKRCNWAAIGLAIVLCPASAVSGSDAIVIDGRSGAVTTPPSSSYLPNQTVEACVRPANLIAYRYVIEFDAGTAIAVSEFVVGAGSVNVLQSARAEKASRTEGAVLQDIEAARKEVREADTEITKLGRHVVLGESVLHAASTALEMRVSAYEKDKEWEWGDPTRPAGGEPAGGWLKTAETERDATLAKINALKSFVLKAKCCIAGVDQAEVEKIRVASATLETRLEQVGSALSALEAEVKRWKTIAARFAQPEFCSSFTPREAGKRHTITVRRIAASSWAGVSAGEVPGDGGGPARAEGKDHSADCLECSDESSVLTRTTFEVHARARFNIALAIGGVLKPREQAFGVVSDVDGSGALSYSLQRTDQGGTFDSTPAALFGIYFREIDPFAPRKPALMAVFGTELSSSPKTVLVGLGVDFAQGLTLNVGLTHYKATELAPGWSPDDPVPAKEDGAPLITTAPTIQRPRVGFFVAVGFRPSLFSLLWKKP